MPELAAFAAAWAALEARLPAVQRVRMEGVDPEALPARTTAWLALGYPLKWGTTSFACPAAVRAHWDAHGAALRALGALAAPGPRLRLGLVGDCMWMRDGWSSWASPATRRLLDSLGALVGNLETPLHELGAPPASLLWRLQALLPDMVTYSSPAHFLHAFRRGGAAGCAPGAPPLVGCWSVANNHSADCGAAGARATLAALRAERTPCSGLRLDGDGATWCCFERAAAEAGGGGEAVPRRSPRRGAPPALAPTLRVGFYAATFGVNFPQKAAECAAQQARPHCRRTARPHASQVVLQTLPGLAAAAADGSGCELGEALRALAEMRAAGCGLRIISLHWGHEFEGYATTGQMAVARALVRAGADVVLGSHSHVAQPAEVLLVNGYQGESEAERRALEGVPACSRLGGCEGAARKALVLYGMGNFCSTMFNELCRTALLVSLQLRPPAADAPPDAPWRWDAPAWHWLFNEAAVVRGAALAAAQHRRLLLVRSVGADAPPPAGEEARLCARKRALVDFMEAHVLGGSSAGGLPEEAKPPPFRL